MLASLRLVMFDNLVNLVILFLNFQASPNLQREQFHIPGFRCWLPFTAYLFLRPPFKKPKHPRSFFSSKPKSKPAPSDVILCCLMSMAKCSPWRSWRTAAPSLRGWPHDPLGSSSKHKGSTRGFKLWTQFYCKMYIVFTWISISMCIWLMIYY